MRASARMVSGTSVERVGCVVRPVAAGAGGVPDHVRGSEAQDPGEHGWRDLGAELVEGGQPGPARFDADGAQPASQARGCEVATGSLTGEQSAPEELLVRRVYAAGLCPPTEF